MSGIIASFNKRYITLAPVAGCIGLAFSLKDPQGLLKGIGSEGISIALLVRYYIRRIFGFSDLPNGQSYRHFL